MIFSKPVFLPLCAARQQTALEQEVHTAQESYKSQRRSSPQKRSEEACCTLSSSRAESELVERVTGDRDCEQGVGEDPECYQASTERLVRVLQGLLGVFLGSHVWSQSTLDGLFELRVNVSLWQIDFLDDCGFSICPLLRSRRWKRIGLVRSLGTPGNIVPVGECVNHQDVDVRGHHQQVLKERGEHVPWIEVEERGHKVQTKGGCKCDDNDTRSGRSEEGFDEVCRSSIGVESWASGESVHDQVEGVHNNVELNQGVNTEGGDVRPSATLGSVTKSEDELQQEECQVDVFDNSVDIWCHRVAEGKSSLIVAVTRHTDQIDDDSGSQIVGSCRLLAEL